MLNDKAYFKIHFNIRFFFNFLKIFENFYTNTTVLLNSLQYVTRTEKKIKCVQWFAQARAHANASTFCFLVPRVLSLSLSFLSNRPSPLGLGSHIEILMNLPRLSWRQRSVKLHAYWQFFVGDLSSLCEMPKYLRLVVVGGSCVGKTAVIEQAVFGNHSPGQVCLKYFHLTLTCFSQRG